MTDENNEMKLDRPLVVHKSDDASYSENTYDDGMSATHFDDETDEPVTLERHRFKKEKKSHKGVWFLLALIAIGVSVLCGLFYSGKLSLDKEPSTTAKPERTYSTEEQNEFDGIITVKSTYVFFEGTEVDGLKGLENEVKYLEKGTKFIIQVEGDTDNDFLNYEVLTMLSGYGIDYEIKHIVSSGLKSKYETTSSTTTTTTTAVADQTSSLG